ncbi:MAG: nucleotidyltransferase, partial [Candidatus Thermoplasmatota archaeon]|nr:nucleotidyltransferase [Candidatus Thermoplasmatota archaeon]
VSTNSIIKNKNFDVYLQGSYINSTNIRGDSDVDLVVQLNDTFRGDVSLLTEPEKTVYSSSFSDANYTWETFRSDVLQTLRNYYGIPAITEGNKSLKIIGSSGRLSADVVVCIQYRKFQRFPSINGQQYTEGIAFKTQRDSRWIINFPKSHLSNGEKKNNSFNTSGKYKPTIRFFKNARSYLVNNCVIKQDLAPSYFIESLLYNVPNNHFENNYQNTFFNSMKWLINSFKNEEYKKLICQNEQLPLFGESTEQWSITNAIEFMRKLLDLWETWK